MAYKTSVFPEGGYDTFIQLYDLPPSYESLVLEYAQLRAKDRTPQEEIRFNELTGMLQNYILDTEKWNKFCDALTGVQKFFLENTQGYIDNLKTETRQTVDAGKVEINATKDSALISIENKKDNIINYMDETTAGAIRNDIGVMGDSTIEGRSLIDKTNKLKSDVDAIDNRIGNLTTNKVDKEAGKRLITDIEANKLAGIEAGANKYVHPAGTNPHGTTKTDVNLGLVDNVKQMPISGGTFTGQAIAQANTAYTTAQIRNVILSTADATGVAPNGAIWIKYKA